MDTEYFPDGVTPIDGWFYDLRVPELSGLGRKYVLTDYDILDDGRLHTEEIQRLIDLAAESGGGVIVVPRGTYRTGALFFKPGVHLYVEDGGVLRGSDDPADYPLRKTRIEGETCRYFSALINADGADGFTMCGPGTVDGNGMRSWRAFRLRRMWNPDCTNKDEQRPRLVYVSNSRDVTVAGLRLQNSHFWTTHFYKCQRVKLLGCSIYSPASPVRAPSTDAVDLDVCSDVLIKNCRMEVNDDAVVLKGGKGPWADEDPDNGANQRILVEDCVYGFCHGCLTCGSESVHDKNILVRRIRVLDGNNLLWLKLRPDTPQHYEHIAVEGAEGKVRNFLTVRPWTQFFDLKGRTDKPKSLAEHITLRDCRVKCDTFFNVEPSPEQYTLRDFTLEDLRILARSGPIDGSAIENLTVNRVTAESADQ